MYPTKVIHRLWLGPRAKPREYERYKAEWKALNPEWSVLDWRENVYPIVRSNRDDLWQILLDLADRDAQRYGIELYVQMADVIGYFLVERYGGVYVNCDMQPLRPLEGLPNKAWASYENHEDGRIVNAAIGAPYPEDRFWRGLLGDLPERYWSHRLDEMVMSTGPGYLTDYANAHRDQIEVLPVEAFNPVHWKQIAEGGDASGFSYPESSYAVHHWGHKKDGRSNIVETATQ